MPFEISINAEHPFLVQIDEVERPIYQKPARFSALQGSSVLKIRFPENENVTPGYMYQLAATIRILFLNTDQMLSFTGSDWPPLTEHLPAFNHLICAYDPGAYEGRGALYRDLNAFFRKYRSKETDYAYINNSVPWILLLNQSKVTLLRLRLEFTLIDMFGRLYPNGNGSWKVFRSFFLHHYEHGYRHELQRFLMNFIEPLHTVERTVRNDPLTGAFNSLRNVINSVLNSRNIRNENEKIARVVYLLRCRYFHGNMTATYLVDPSGHGFVEEMECVCHTLIMATEGELFDSFINMAG